TTRTLIGARERERDLGHFEYQRHLLEVANIRMLFHRDERESRIAGVQWIMKRETSQPAATLDAKVSFLYRGTLRKIGIINLASRDLDGLIERLEAAIADEDVDFVFVITSDKTRLQAIQKHIAGALGDAPILKDRVALATHKQLYKLGIVNN